MTTRRPRGRIALVAATCVVALTVMLPSPAAAAVPRASCAVDAGAAAKRLHQRAGGHARKGRKLRRRAVLLRKRSRAAIRRARAGIHPRRARRRAPRLRRRARTALRRSRRHTRRAARLRADARGCARFSAHGLAPGGQAIGSPAVGIEGGIRYRSGDDLVQTIAALRAAGATHTREAIAWNRVEPTQGAFDWEQTDRWVGAAAAQGLQVVAILNAPPAWATGSSDPSVAPVEGQALADYARYVRATVERYGSNGSFWAQNPSIPKLPITHWDLWNEPYMQAFWHNGGDHAWPDPEGYAQMFRAAVQEARRAGDPAARFMAEVDVTTTDSQNQPFLERMFDAAPDLAAHMDVASIHPYVHTNGRSPEVCEPERDDTINRYNFCRVKTLRRILDRRGAAAAGMWITELGWSTCPSCSQWKVSEETQARYVRDTFRLLREWKLVDGLIWWVYKSHEDDPARTQDWFGFVRADGSPKPAWSAFSEEARHGL